jgi:uncharacterized membrane-anchored protein
MFATMDDRIVVPASLPVLSKQKPLKRSASAIWLVVALPLLLLGSFVAAKSATLLHGQRICVRASVVDPCDLFRGDYLMLAFDTPAVKNIAEGTELYVVYGRPSGKSKLWKSVSLSKNHPQIANGQICVKGTVKNQALEFPFSRAFISQGLGKTVNSNSELEAELVTDGDGNAVLAGLSENGKQITRL